MEGTKHAGPILVAVIAAIAAILGSVAGGTASYLGNKAILGKQVEREERQQKVAARGVARVYAEQVVSARRVLRFALSTDRWPQRNDLSYFDLPDLEDRRLVQSRLSVMSAEAVSDADGVLRAVASVVVVEPGNALSARARQLLRSDLVTLEHGARALQELDT